MSDKAARDCAPPNQTDSDFDNQRKGYRDYSVEEKFIALAAVDLNGGNIYRTARAIEIPYATLHGWVEERKSGSIKLSNFEREKRGDLATKLESLIHDLVEAMPGKVGKATLSQCAVTLGIAVDKTRILRGEGLEPDPAMELCRLLGINRNQIPTSLELPPGRELPPELLAQLDAITTTATVRHAEPQTSPPSKEAQPESVDSAPDTPESAPTDLAPKLQSPQEPDKPIITCADDLLPKPKRSHISTNTVAASAERERNPPER